jgi:hypothetical protein
MTKTGGEIVTVVYNSVKSSSLRLAVEGDLYRDDERPDNATTEDIVVSILAGDNEQIQSGFINLNIYVPDGVNQEGVKAKDSKRCTELEIIANAFVGSISLLSEYQFALDKIVQSFAVEGIEQHFINCRIKFRCTTF